MRHYLFMDAETKTCSKCGEVKPVDAFQRGRGQCKACDKAWRCANPERLRAIEAAYRERHRERLAAIKKSWRKSNLEKARATVKAWKKANPEKVRAHQEAWKKANPEKMRKYREVWSKENPDKIRATDADQRSKLSDSYVKSLITQDSPIKAAYVPQSLIDLKRVQVQITRKLKEFKKCK